LVRYIHLNPLRAGIVPDLRRLNGYRYCGHGALLGKHGNGFQHTQVVLKRFSETVQAARIRYGEFVKEGIAQGKHPELSGGGLVRSAGGWSAVKMLRKSRLFQKADERILGDGDFVEQALGRLNERFEPAYELSAQGYDFDRIVRRVADLLDMSEAEVRSPAKRRAVVKARSMVCYWSYQYLGISQTELARKYGVSQPAVCAAVQKGQKINEENGFRLLKDDIL